MLGERTFIRKVLKWKGTTWGGQHIALSGLYTPIINILVHFETNPYFHMTNTGHSTEKTTRCSLCHKAWSGLEMAPLSTKYLQLIFTEDKCDYISHITIIVISAKVLSQEIQGRFGLIKEAKEIS